MISSVTAPWVSVSCDYRVWQSSAGFCRLSAIGLFGESQIWSAPCWGRMVQCLFCWALIPLYCLALGKFYRDKTENWDSYLPCLIFMIQCGLSKCQIQTCRMMQILQRCVQAENPNVFTWANLTPQKSKSWFLILMIHITADMKETSLLTCRSLGKVGVNSSVGQVTLELSLLLTWIIILLFIRLITFWCVILCALRTHLVKVISKTDLHWQD